MFNTTGRAGLGGGFHRVDQNPHHHATHTQVGALFGDRWEGSPPLMVQKQSAVTQLMPQNTKRPPQPTETYAASYQLGKIYQTNFCKMLDLQEKLLDKKISQHDQDLTSLPTRMRMGSASSTFALCKEDVMNGFGKDGLNPLMRAALMGSLEDVVFWLRLGARPQIQDLGGRTAWDWFHIRKIALDQFGRMDALWIQPFQIIDALLKVCRSDRQQMRLQSWKAGLAQAVEELSPALFKYYIACGPTMDCYQASCGQGKNENGSSKAFFNVKPIILRLLQSHLMHSKDPRIHCRDNPYHNSFQRGTQWVEVSRVLLDHIKKVNKDCLFDWAFGCYAQDPLQDALSIEVLELLLEKGADIHAVNEKGQSILNRAKELKLSPKLIEALSREVQKSEELLYYSFFSLLNDP